MILGRVLWCIVSACSVVWAEEHFLLSLFNKKSTDITEQLIKKSTQHIQQVPPDRAHTFFFGSFEQAYIQQYQNVMTRTLQEFSSASYMPHKTVGIALSGGGYRAMICALGYTKGIEALGLLPAVSHISTLSGSTWFLAPWLFYNELKGERVTVGDYYQHVKELIAQKKYNPFSISIGCTFDFMTFIRTVVIPKKMYNQSCNIIDLYGALLANVLFTGWPTNKKYTLNLYDQREIPQQYGVPWPLYTAVASYKNRSTFFGYNIYHWYEFGPDMVRNSSLGYAMPSYALNMQYRDDGTVIPMPPMPFSSLLGLFGSAFSVHVRDVERILFPEASLDDVNTDDTPLECTVFTPQPNRFFIEKVLKLLVSKTASLRIGKKRFASMKLYNPWYTARSDVFDNHIVEQKELTVVDAGIDYNIPLLPLLVPERAIGLIIVGDASSDVMLGDQELQKGLRALKQQGIHYVRDNTVYSDQETYGYVSKKCIIVYRPDMVSSAQQTAAKLPIIVYVNFLKDEYLINHMRKTLGELIDDAALDQFNPNSCVSDRCGTANFNYSVDDFVALVGIAQFNVMAHKKLLQALIARM